MRGPNIAPGLFTANSVRSGLGSTSMFFQAPPWVFYVLPWTYLDPNIVGFRVPNSEIHPPMEGLRFNPKWRGTGRMVMLRTEGWSVGYSIGLSKKRL